MKYLKEETMETVVEVINFENCHIENAMKELGSVDQICHLLLLMLRSHENPLLI